MQKPLVSPYSGAALLTSTPPPFRGEFELGEQLGQVGVYGCRGGDILGLARYTAARDALLMVTVNESIFVK